MCSMSTPSFGMKSVSSLHFYLCEVYMTKSQTTILMLRVTNSMESSPLINLRMRWWIRWKVQILSTSINYQENSKTTINGLMFSNHCSNNFYCSLLIPYKSMGTWNWFEMIFIMMCFNSIHSLSFDRLANFSSLRLFHGSCYAFSTV